MEKFQDLQKTFFRYLTILSYTCQRCNFAFLLQNGVSGIDATATTSTFSNINVLSNSSPSVATAPSFGVNSPTTFVNNTPPVPPANHSGHNIAQSSASNTNASRNTTSNFVPPQTISINSADARIKDTVELCYFAISSLKVSNLERIRMNKGVYTCPVILAQQCSASSREITRGIKTSWLKSRKV